MLKFLIILALIIYIFYKVGGFLFRVFFLGASEYEQQKRHQQRYRNQEPPHRRAPDSNLNIDYVPREKRKKNEEGYNGGEYVDYEEVD